MDTEVKIVVYTFLFNILVFLIKSVFPLIFRTKKDVVEIKGKESVVANTDSQTMKNFQDLLDAQMEKNKERDDELDELKNLIDGLSDKNEILTSDSEEMRRSIEKLTKENSALEAIINSLEAVIVSEQVDKQRLREGIRKLIEQMKKAGLRPAFNLGH